MPARHEILSTISDARAEADIAANALAKAWAIGLYAADRDDALDSQLRDFRAALERMNEAAVKLGLRAPVIRFPARGANFRFAGKIDASGEVRHPEAPDAA